MKSGYKIILPAMAAVMVFWIGDAFIASKLIEGTSLWKTLITEISADVFFRRLVVTVCIVFLGIPLATVIARKRRLRMALDESEKRARHLFAEAPLPYQSLGQNGQIIEVNRPWLLTLGYSAGEVIGRNFEQFMTPAYSEKYRSVLPKLTATGQFTGVELELVRKDGSIVVASFNGKVVNDENGNFQRTQCLFVDITERRRFEKELQASEEKYRVLVEHASEAIFVAQNGIVKFCNRRMSEILGYSAERIMSEPFANYIYANDREAALERHHRRLAGEKLSSTHDYRIIAADDSLKWLEINGILIDWEGRPATLNFANDITERKQAELALREERRRLKDIIKGTNVGTWEWNVQTGETVFSERWAEIVGYTLEELSPISIETWLKLAHPQDLQRSNELLQRHFDGEINYYECESKMRHKNGSWVWVLDRGRVHSWTDDGKPLLMSGTHQDITERKRGEEKLIAIMKAVESTSDAVGISDAQGHHIYQNRALSELFGYATAEELEAAGGGPITVKDPEVAQEMFEKILSGKSWAGELEMVTKGGRVFPAYERADAINDHEGRLIGIIGIITDITERKRAELTLADERRRLADIIRGTNVGTWEFDANTGISVISNRWAEILGYTLEELSPITMQKWNEMTHPDDLQASNEALRQHFEGERDYYECELRMRHKNGNWVWILDRGRVHTWSDDGKPLLMSGTHQDITERKRAEDALYQRESYLSAIIENQPGLTWLKDTNGRFLSVNHQFAKSCGKDTPEDVVGLTDHNIWPQDLADKYQADDAKVMTAATPFTVEEPILDQGAVKWFETCKTPVIDNRGKIIGTTGFARNITERKRTEETLRESKERYKRLLQSVTDYIYTVKIADGKPVSTSHGEGCLAVTGFTSKEFEENPYLWLQMIVEEDRSAVQEHVHAVMTGTTTSPLEHRIVHKNGSIRWVRNTPSVHADESGSIVSYEGLISDITEQRAAKDELALNETKYRTLFESAQDAIFLMKEYFFVDCNSTTCEMFCCTREQILGKPPDQFSPEIQADGNRSKDKALEKMNQALAGRPQFFEWTHTKLDGSCFDAEVKLNGIEIAGEQHILAIVRDITERKRSQNALERSLSLQRATLESTADGILVVDQVGKVSSFNRKFLEMWRIPEFLTVLKDDEKLLQFVVDQLKDPRRFAERVNQLYANPESQSYDTVEFKDGRVFERYSQPQRVGDEVVGRVWSFRDLTESKRVEMELARLATATEQAAEAIVMIDLEGQIEYVNPAFETITGYRRDETIGKNMRTMSSSEHDDDFHNELWRVLREGQVWTGRLRSCRKDGSVYEEECSISPIRDRNGVIVSYVAVKRDVTQEAELESRLRQSQKLEAVGLLAAGIAHDFNNLLAGIKGFAELLTLDEEAGPKASGYAEEILKAAGRAADLTGQLLAFARKGKFLSILVDVNEVIDEVIAMLEHSIDRRVEIKKTYCAERPFISGDPSQIQSAILNLAINARDAMPEGGRLTFQTENVHLDETYCQLHSLDLGAGDYLSVSLIDTGIGMDEAIMAHIFDPFFTTKALGQGTGLGLAGVYGCLRDHHGSVEVTSQVGSGSTFRLLFPVAAEEDEQAIPSERRLKLTGEERLLLVEDEEVVRNLAIKILTNAGYRVTACADGLEAVALYRDRAAEFDLILLDMMMPNMHGKDVFAAMKQINPHMCALLMSGYSDTDVHEILDQGIQGFIPKPFRSKQLLQKIREALDTTTSPVEKQSQPQ